MDTAIGGAQTVHCGRDQACAQHHQLLERLKAAASPTLNRHRAQRDAAGAPAAAMPALAPAASAGMALLAAAAEVSAHGAWGQQDAAPAAPGSNASQAAVGGGTATAEPPSLVAAPAAKRQRVVPTAAGVLALEHPGQQQHAAAERQAPLIVRGRASDAPGGAAGALSFGPPPQPSLPPHAAVREDSPPTIPPDVACFTFTPEYLINPEAKGPGRAAADAPASPPSGGRSAAAAAAPRPLPPSSSRGSSSSLRPIDPRTADQYRGVHYDAPTGTFEARLMRNKLGTVLRLRGYGDPAAAARAFDRAAICLAHLRPKAPDLNFPATDYEGEVLPDLAGLPVADMRAIMEACFSGPHAGLCCQRRYDCGSSGGMMALPGGGSNASKKMPPPVMWPPQLAGRTLSMPASLGPAAYGLADEAHVVQRQQLLIQQQQQVIQALQSMVGRQAGGAAAAGGMAPRLAAAAAAVPHSRDPVAAPALAPPQQPRQQPTHDTVSAPQAAALAAAARAGVQALRQAAAGIDASLQRFVVDLAAGPAALDGGSPARAAGSPAAADRPLPAEMRPAAAAIQACLQQQAVLKQLLQVLGATPALPRRELDRLQAAMEALSSALCACCTTVLQASEQHKARAGAASPPGEAPGAAAADAMNAWHDRLSLSLSTAADHVVASRQLVQALAAAGAF